MVQSTFPMDNGATRSISQLYSELTGYLDEHWGRGHQVWVSGEVQKFSDHRSGHCYLDLIDPTKSGRDAPTLKVKCWRMQWAPIKGSLRTEGLAITDGTVLRVRGYVDLYAPRGELSFVITAIDMEALRLASLGEHARRRADLLGRLGEEGLLEANASLRMPEVPTHVGLVASKDTEGFNDFVGMLDASGFRFSVTLARSSVQGARAPNELAGAIAALQTKHCDVICLVRGGGSQSDLAAFDDERVARAIAACAVPVLTGVGHTGDVSVADLVAHQSFRTPTACAESLAAIVREWYATHVGEAARRLAESAEACMEQLDAANAQSRRHLVVVARHRVERAGDHLAHAAASVARRAPHVVVCSEAWVSSRAGRLVPLAERRLEEASAVLGNRLALLAAYDPARVLARGWSITTDEAGRIVRSVEGIEVGTTLATRVADGVARSSVTAVERT